MKPKTPPASTPTIDTHESGRPLGPPEHAGDDVVPVVTDPESQGTDFTTWLKPQREASQLRRVLARIDVIDRELPRVLTRNRELRAAILARLGLIPATAEVIPFQQKKRD